MVKSRFTPELITLTLDLYFSGLSLRKVARTISDHFDTHVGATTIYDWIQRYVPLIPGYVKTLTPELSNTWHVDELFVKMRKEPPAIYNRDIAYLWNVMDRRTRFLLASKLSEDRDATGSMAAFKEAAASANDSIPENVFTDAHRSYYQGVEVLGPVKHVAKCGIAKSHHATTTGLKGSTALYENV